MCPTAYAARARESYMDIYMCIYMYIYMDIYMDIYMRLGSSKRLVHGKPIHTPN